MENNLQKQRQLESAYQNAQREVIKANLKYNKWIWIRIFNKRNLKQIIIWTEHMNKIFRELREITRENYPERFI